MDISEAKSALKVVNSLRTAIQRGYITDCNLPEYVTYGMGAYIVRPDANACHKQLCKMAQLLRTIIKMHQFGLTQ